MSKFIKSVSYALQGILTIFSTQNNFKIHIVATLFVIISGLYFEVSNVEWALLMLTCGIVLSAEAFNTALEFLTDLVSPEFHPLAQKTKDAAAAGVLIVAFFSIIIFFYILFPKFWSLL